MVKEVDRPSGQISKDFSIGLQKTREIDVDRYDGVLVAQVFVLTQDLKIFVSVVDNVDR